jgi:hypothetical protein
MNVAGEQQFLVAAKLLLKFFPVFPELHVELSGKFREALRKPLVVIALPADAVSVEKVPCLCFAGKYRAMDL